MPARGAKGDPALAALVRDRQDLVGDMRRFRLMKIDGGCHCGYITYEAEADPEKVGICHCSDCQKLSGSAFRTAIRVTSDNFRMLSGEPTIYAKTAESGAKSAQAFCPRCGSPIYAARFGDAPKFYNIRLGTVRQRDQLVPKCQFWSRSELHWLPSLATIPKVEKQERRTEPRSPA